MKPRRFSWFSWTFLEGTRDEFYNDSLRNDDLSARARRVATILRVWKCDASDPSNLLASKPVHQFIAIRNLWHTVITRRALCSSLSWINTLHAITIYRILRLLETSQLMCALMNVVFQFFFWAPVNVRFNIHRSWPRSVQEQIAFLFKIHISCHISYHVSRHADLRLELLDECVQYRVNSMLFDENAISSTSMRHYILRLKRGFSFLLRINRNKHLQFGKYAYFALERSSNPARSLLNWRTSVYDFKINCWVIIATNGIYGSIIINCYAYWLNCLLTNIIEG